MNASRRVYLLLVSVFVVLLGAQRATAQCVSLTTLGSPSSQNFTALANAGTNVAWTDNSTIAGWYATRTTYNAGTGSSNTGAMYSFGVAGVNPVTDRALGGVASGGTGTFYWAGCFTNNTGSALSSVDIAYIGEQWRDGLPVPAAAQTIAFEYQVAAAGVITDADTPTTGWTAVPALDFTGPIPGTAAVALDGNAAANRTAKAATITAAVPIGNQFWVRWRDINDTSNDHGLAVDDFSITPQAGANAPILPNCPTPITTNSGVATSGPVSATDADGTVISATITGITPSNPGTITLTGFTPAGGVGGTANATLNVSNTTPANTYSVTIQWANNDGVPQTANCVVSVVVNPPPVIVFIHDVQGNGAATPIPGASVTIEGVVTGDFQPIPNDNRLSGFFVQEENADFDADPLTSEGIFIFCSACPTNVAEGQKVQVTGTVSEFNNLTEITATTAGSVVITNAGNNLAQVSASTIDLPVVGVIDDFYEPMESMLVTFVDTLTVSEYFEQARYGRIELFEGTRPRTFNESNPPSVAGFAAHNDNLNRRRVYLDDDDNVENSVLNLTDGQQFVFHPQANGGLSIGTQGTDFFRGGDTISGLTGILDFSFSGGTSPNEWRVRPVAASPATFTAVNVRPPAPPAVGGAIRAASVNVLNYFTTLNVRGADSAAELTRQRERTSIVLCALNTDVAALMEIENHPTNATINDLLGDVNTRCGGAHPYTFVNTGGALGTDQIRIMLIYRTGVLSPVGAPLSDMDAVHNRPPTAQTFDVVDPLNPAFGQRFTALANHSKSKGCGGASGADLDQNDGQGCFSATRLAQANRLISWVNGTVVPAAGDPDVLMLGDFNAYPQETSAAAITGAGFTDLETALLGSAAYSYLFDGQIGHIDYAWSSASLTPQVTGVAPWHINADENPLFDYNDEIKDGAAEQTFEEKPDGSALVPPRVLFQPATAQRSSDHEPVLLGIFQIADLLVTKTDSPDPVNAGSNLTYTITVTNNGPDAAASASWSDTLPAGTTFVSLPAVAGWSCTTPAVGAGGTVTCNNPSFAVGSSVFTLTVHVDPSVAAGTVLSNTATATSAAADGNPGNESDTETTTVAGSADLQISKTDTPDPVTAGQNITYQLTLTNNGPSNAASASFSDTVPPGTTFVSLSTTGSWSCTTPAVGSGGTVSCTNASFGVTVDFFTIVVNVDPSVAAGTVLSNTATLSSATADPTPGNESDTATTTVAASANLQISKTDTPDPVTAGQNITYQLTLTNNGPSSATSASFSDTLPTGTTFVSLSTTGSWSCTTPAVGSGGTVSCTNASFGVTVDFFTIVVNVGPSVAAGTVLSNTATLSSATSDPNPGNESDTATTTVAASADLQISKTDTPDPVNAGSNITYQITMTNNGPSNAASASFFDTLPAGTTFVSLSTTGPWSCTTPAVGSGGTVSCTNASFGVTVDFFTIVVHVGPSVAAGTVLSNTATLSSATSDPNPGNESDTAPTTVATAANIQVTKTDSPDPVTAGTNLTYTITVLNAGPSDAATVALADTVPANTTFVSLTSPGGWSCTTPAVGGTGAINCSIATIPAGGSGVFTLVVNVDASTANGTILSNTATATSATTDPAPGDESATATTSVGVGSADVSILKTDTPDPISAGSTLMYTITVANAGPSDAANVSFSDTVPAGTTFINLQSPGGWSCNTPGVGGTGLINCTIPTFPDGGNAVFTILMQVNSALATGTIITNTATVTSTTADANGANNSSTTTTTIQPITNFTATKAVSGTFISGSTVTYTVVLTNNMGHTQNNNFANEFADILPAGLALTGATASSGTILTILPSNVVTWNGSIPNATSLTITITATITASSGTISNQGNAIIDTDNNGQNESAVFTDDPSTAAPGDPTSFTIVPSPANVTGTKSASGSFTPGSTVTYTVVLSNAGLGAQGNNAGDEFVDVLPSQLTLISATANSGTAVANVGTNTVTWNGSIPAGGSVTITIQALLEADVPVGSTIANQGTINADTNGDGTNEQGTATTSNGAGNPFVVAAAPAAAADIPALDPRSLIALASLLAVIGVLIARRS